MSLRPDPTDVNTLIPELSQWNEGKGVSADAWISMMGNFELAIGYSLIFWPRFIAFEGYVLHEGFTVESLRSFEEATGGNRQAVEAVMNHIHIVDLHANVQEPNEAQILYLMRTLKQIWDVKLKVDFPDRRFVVSAIEEPGLNPVDYELTFYQT